MWRMDTENVGDIKSTIHDKAENEKWKQRSWPLEEEAVLAKKAQEEVGDNESGRQFQKMTRFPCEHHWCLSLK